MTYTAEQLRRDAIAIERMHGETLTVEWRGHQASQLRAHADALEENARLKAERDTSVAVTERIKVALRIRGTGSYVEWAAYCRDALDKLERADAVRVLGEQLAERDAAMLGLVAAKNETEQIIEKQEAEIVALKGHAEAMCRILQMGDGGFDRPETAAYRAAYPKE